MDRQASLQVQHIDRLGSNVEQEPGEEPNEQGNLEEHLVLPLRPRVSVHWTDDTVDNEHLGRKSSKKCCIYHAPRQFGKWSDTEDSGKDITHGSWLKHPATSIELACAQFTIRALTWLSSFAMETSPAASAQIPKGNSIQGADASGGQRNQQARETRAMTSVMGTAMRVMLKRQPQARPKGAILEWDRGRQAPFDEGSRACSPFTGSSIKTCGALPGGLLTLMI